MLSAKRRQVSRDLRRRYIVDHAGQQDDQGSLSASLREVQKGFVVIGLLEGRKAVETCMEQSIHLRSAPTNWDVRFDAIGETHQAYRVPLVQRNVTEHEHRVESIVQQAQPRYSAVINLPQSTRKTIRWLWSV